MVMANLPALKLKSSPEDRFVEALIQQMASGTHPRDIARQVYPDRRAGAAGRETNRLRKRLYRKLRSLALQDPRVAQGILEEARLELMLALVPSTRSLAGRATRTGRPDAVKLLYEASGFHNPRVKHDHSGEIKVKLEMPRPAFEQVVDGEVVEEGESIA